MESHVVDSQDLIGRPPNSPPHSVCYQSSGSLSPDDNDGSLYVAPIPRTSTEQDICALFAVHGNVVDVVFNQDDEIDDQRGGYCFVKFAKLEDADRAIAALNDQYTFPGGLAPIKVKFAQGRPGKPFVVGCMNKEATEEEIVKGRENPLEVPFADSKKPRTGESRPFSHSVGQEQILQSPNQTNSECYPSEEKLSDDDAHAPIPEYLESDDDDMEDIGVPFYQPVILDEAGHMYFDPPAKSYIQRYNEKQNASYEFVELVALSTQQRPVEYYYTIKAKNSVDGSVEIFQVKITKHAGGVETVDEYRISDVPYLSEAQLCPSIPIIRVFKDVHLGGPHHTKEPSV